MVSNYFSCIVLWINWYLCESAFFLKKERKKESTVAIHFHSMERNTMSRGCLWISLQLNPHTSSHYRSSDDCESHWFIFIPSSRSNLINAPMRHGFIKILYTFISCQVVFESSVMRNGLYKYIWLQCFGISEWNSSHTNLYFTFWHL